MATGNPRCFMTLQNSVVTSFEKKLKEQRDGKGLKQQERSELDAALTGRIGKPFRATPNYMPTHANFEGMDKTPLLSQFVEWFKKEYPHVPVNATIYAASGNTIASKTTGITMGGETPSSSSGSEDEGQSGDKKRNRGGKTGNKVRKPARRAIALDSTEEENDSDDDPMHGAAGAKSSSKKEDQVISPDLKQTVQSMVHEMVQNGIAKEIAKEMAIAFQQDAAAIVGNSSIQLQQIAAGTADDAKRKLQASLELQAAAIGSSTIHALNEHTRDGAGQLMYAYKALEQSQAIAAQAQALAASLEQSKNEKEQVRMALEAELQKVVAKGTRDLEDSAVATKHMTFQELEEEIRQSVRRESLTEASRREEELIAKTRVLLEQMKLDLSNSTSSSQAAPPPQVKINLKAPTGSSLTKADVDDVLIKRMLSLRTELMQPAVQAGGLIPSVPVVNQAGVLASPTNVQADGGKQKRKRYESDDEQEATDDKKHKHTKGNSFFKSVFEVVDTAAHFLNGGAKKKSK